MEVFHQIHCLDFIRQYTYKDEYDYSALPSFDGSARLVREVSEATRSGWVSGWVLEADSHSMSITASTVCGSFCNARQT